MSTVSTALQPWPEMSDVPGEEAIFGLEAVRGHLERKGKGNNYKKLQRYPTSNQGVKEFSFLIRFNSLNRLSSQTYWLKAEFQTL
eukprot:584192-Pelagomonas_calceolata.AAC.2